MILQVELKSIMMFVALATGVYLVHRFTSLHLELPIAIAATMGTAVAILLGFKNNSAFDRWWEARKIWGAIVNSSRTFGVQLLTYTDCNEVLSESERQDLLQDLYRRHLAYINTLRLQLRGLETAPAIKQWLSHDDVEHLKDARNQATQILTRQGLVLRKMAKKKLLDQFRLFELMQTIGAFFDHQGKAERVLLLPLCFVEALGWKMIPLVVLISQVFIMLDRAGTFTEEPFDNSFNDVAMNAICRTIEIDMLQQLGATEIPVPLEPIEGVLM